MTDYSHCYPDRGTRRMCESDFGELLRYVVHTDTKGKMSITTTSSLSNSLNGLQWVDQLPPRS